MEKYLALLLAVEKYKKSGLDFNTTQKSLIRDKFDQNDINFIFSRYTFNSFTGSEADAKQKLNLLNPMRAAEYADAVVSDKSHEDSELMLLDATAADASPNYTQKYEYTDSFLRRLGMGWWKWLGLLLFINTVIFILVYFGFPIIISFGVGNILYFALVFYLVSKK